MRSRSYFFLRLLCLLAASSLALAQQSAPPSPTQRDPSALLAIRQALSAMNATSLLIQISSAQCTGSIQGVQGTGVQSGTFIWEHQFSASGFQFRSEFQNGAQDNIFVFNGTTSSTSINGKVGTIPSYVAQALTPFHLPEVVLNMFLANVSYSLTLGSPVQVHGMTATHVIANLNTDTVTQTVTSEDWYFNPASGLPLRVEYRLPDGQNAQSYTKAATDFGNYQPVAGILVPLALVASVDGTADSTIIISSVQWNYPVGSNDFTLTGSGQ